MGTLWVSQRSRVEGSVSLLPRSFASTLTMTRLTSLLLLDRPVIHAIQTFQFVLLRTICRLVSRHDVQTISRHPIRANQLIDFEDLNPVRPILLPHEPRFGGINRLVRWTIALLTVDDPELQRLLRFEIE